MRLGTVSRVPRCARFLIAALVVLGSLSGCRQRSPTPTAVPEPPAVILPPPVNPPPITRKPPSDAAAWAQLDRLANQELFSEAAAAAKRLRERAQSQGNQDEWGAALVREMEYRLRLRSGDAEKEGEVRTWRELPWPQTPLPHLQVALYYTETLTWMMFDKSYQPGENDDRVAPAHLAAPTSWTWEQMSSAMQQTLGPMWERRAALGGTPVDALAPMLTANKYPRAVRGTLRDALTYRLVELLSHAERWRPEELAGLGRLDFTALLRGDALAALSVRIDDPRQHPMVRLLAALTDLESWHSRSGRPEAALEARLTRLRMLRGTFPSPAQRAELRADLERRLLDPALKNMSWSAMARAELAYQLRDEVNDPRRAHDIAAQGAQEFPDSEGGKVCAHLVAELAAPTFSLSALQVDGAGKPAIRVTHRHQSALYFRAYLLDVRSIIDGARGSSDPIPDQSDALNWIQGGRAGARSSHGPDAEWTVPLEPTPDYQQHHTDVVPPLKKHGLYIITASQRPDYALSDNSVLAVSFQLSELAIISQTQADGTISATIVEATSGVPALGAKVYAYPVLQPHPHPPEVKVVDQSGSVQFAARGRVNESTALYAERGDDRVFSRGSVYRSSWQEHSAEQSELIYTDRAIYRSGQKLYFKVLAYRGRWNTSQFQPRTGEKLSVTLRDASGTEVAARQLITNDFGTVTGEFLLPVGHLQGRWSLAAAGGRTTVLVEQYKRPTFEVLLRDATEPLRLNRTAVVEGQARYYFGAPVTSGTLHYRVLRDAAKYGFPGAPPRFAPTNTTSLWWVEDHPITVARGEAKLAPDGSFRVQFQMDTDERADKDLVSTYKVVAELTDDGGETRSASRSFRVGFATVQAELQADFGFVLAGEGTAQMKVLRRNLDGAPRPGAGIYKLLRLLQPKQVALLDEAPLRENDHANAPRLALPKPRGRAERTYDPAAVLASWADGEIVHTAPLVHGLAAEEKLTLPALPPGAYRLRYETKDEFGTPCVAAREFLVASAAQGANTALPLALELEHTTVPVGQKLRVLVHSGWAEQPIYLNVWRAGQLVKSLLLPPASALLDATPTRIVELEVEPADRGGFAVEAFSVRDYQLLQLRRQVHVPWDDMRLKLSLSTFRDTLHPGGRETWRIGIAAPDGRTLAKGAAEVLALMYDRSLDLFTPFTPPSPMDLFPVRRAEWHSHSDRSTCESAMTYSLVRDPKDTNYRRRNPLQLIEDSVQLDSVPRARSQDVGGCGTCRVKESKPYRPAVAAESDPEGQRILADPKPRSDFAETAFFFPQLLTDGDGGVAFEFTVPESTTSWRLWAQAVTRSLQSGSVERQVQTMQELMVRPYLPRFLREGDRADLRVMVNNAGSVPYQGTLELAILDAQTRAPRTTAFAVQPSRLDFRVAPGKSTTLSFALSAPREVGLYAFQVMARAGNQSDGEMRPLLVLPGQLHLVQSKVVSLREPGTRTIHFADMKKDDDPTRRQEQLVVAVDAQLFYSALKALPYLVDYPYECVEQTLNRFLSTDILSALFRQHPELVRVAEAFAQSRDREPAAATPPGAAPPVPAKDAAQDTGLLDDSQGSLVREESPWPRLSAGGAPDGQDTRMLRVLVPAVAQANRASALRKLEQAQLPSGGFPWFAGGPASPDMTLYLVQGFARAQEFQVPVQSYLIRRAWGYLVEEYREQYELHLTDGKADAYELTTLNYAASSFPKDERLERMFTTQTRAAILDYTFARWHTLPRRLRAELALTLHRMGRRADAKLVLASILAAARSDAELGTYFLPEERSWLWYGEPIESHAFILRALLELDPQSSKIDGMVEWLLLNKQLNQWKSTRATAEVLYVLAHVLKKAGTLGNKEVAVVRAGDVEQRFTFLPQQYVGKAELVIPAAQIEPARTSTVTIEKLTRGPMFAAATWHFSTEQLPTQGVGELFKVERSYFRPVHRGSADLLTPLAEGEAVALGDELEVQLTVRSQQPASYIHLRDPRAAGLEPEHSLSGYRCDTGVCFYAEVRDSGMNYFFEQLPSGVHVLKYRLRANMAGTFRIGPAALQSLYAPEYTAYSAGHLLKVGAETSH